MSNPSLLVSRTTARPATASGAWPCATPATPTRPAAPTPPARGLHRWVRDISATGIALLVPCEFEPGAALTLELENSDRGVSRVVRARVVHALEVPPDRRWLHGCAFERPLTAEELLAFAE